MPTNELMRQGESTMSERKPELILYGSDADLLEKLRTFSAGLPFLRYEVGYGPQAAASANLDAFWVPLMAAVELFGVSPPFPPHEARVMKTPPAQLQRGFPRFGVVGVATSENDPKTPEYNLRLVMSALLKAVKVFNAQSQDQILRVGLQPDDLELRKVRPETAFGIIRELYDEA